MSSAPAVIQEPYVTLISGDGIMEADLPLCTLKADSLLSYVPKSVKILHSLLMRCELMVRLLEGWGEGMVLPHILCVHRSAHSSTGGGGGSKLQGLSVLYAYVVVR